MTYRMFWNLIIKFGLLLGVCVVIIISLACDGGVHAEGKVHDLDGKAIANAKITLARPTRKLEVLSDANGYFLAGNTVAPGRYKYTVSIAKEGYKTATTDIFTLDHNKLEVTLAPESSTVESAVVIVSR